MNYYERIQKAVDYIENNLYAVIYLDTVAKEAFMSLANLYRLFFALTKYVVHKIYNNCAYMNLKQKLTSVSA